MMSDEEEASEIGTETEYTEEEFIQFVIQQEQKQKQEIELEVSDEDDENLPLSSLVEIRHSNRQKNSQLSMLSKDFQIKLKRVPCLLNEDSVNVTCDRCSLKFTSLSKFLTHLHPKFKNINVNIPKINNNNKKNKSRQSILKTSFNENLNDDVDVSSSGRRKRSHVHFEPEVSDGDDYNNYFDGGGDDNYDEDDIPLFNLIKKPKLEKPAKQKSTLQLLGSHIESKGFDCSQCPKSFRKEKQLNLHVKICHYQRISSSTSTNEKRKSHDNDNGSDNGLEADDSDWIEEEDVEEVKDNDPEFTLERGRVKIKKPPKPKKVNEMELGPVICETCGKVSSCMRIHNDHVIMHIDVRPFICTYPECTAAFKRKGELKRHASRHNETRDQICHICAKAFFNTSDLNCHLLNHGPKRYKCNQEGCEFATVNRETLKKHVRLVHFGERNFSCHICAKSYKREMNLKAHMYHHNPTGEKPWKCKECEWSCYSYRALQNHQRTKHLGLPPFPRWKKPKKQKPVEPEFSQDQQDEQQSQNQSSTSIPSFEDFQYDVI